MPIPMAIGVVKLDNAAGTPTDISSTVTEIVPNAENTVAGYHTIDTRWQKQSEGGSAIGLEVTFLVTPDTGQTHELIRNWYLGTRGQRTLTNDFPDTQVGSLRFSAEVVCGGITELSHNQAGSGDPMRSRASLRVHGTPTFAVIV